MSSRQEEKQRRRAEREAAERAAAHAQRKSARLRAALSALAVVVAIVGVVLVFPKLKGNSQGGAGSPQQLASNVKLPPIKTRDLGAAAKAASCVVSNPAIEGSTHVTSEVTYKNSNPPTSGNHNPEPALDGIYAPGSEPAKENLVHALEHGRVELEYKPGTSRGTVDKIEAVANERLAFGADDYKTLVLQNNTAMPEAFAAVAWGRLMACAAFNQSTYDAVRAFRTAYVDKAPELIPPNN